MKLIIAIVPDSRASSILSALTAEGYRVTRVSSTGGFLRRGSATLLIGVEKQWVSAAIDKIRAACRSDVPTPSSTVGATVFVLEVERFEQS